MLETYVWVRTNFVGFHHWLGAPDEVAYLRSRHRHLFEVYAEVAVNHENRAVEFHTLKHQIDEYLRAHTARVNTEQSCEMIARDIVYLLQTVYNYTVLRVDVSEDGECGGGQCFKKEEE